MFMDFKFSKDSGDSQPQGNSGGKKKQSTLLVLLLILVGGFTYLYFFTDLIKPQEVQKTAEVPAPAPQVVKMPLPPRKGEPAKLEGDTPGNTDALKAATPPPAVAAAPAAKPATVPVNSEPTPAAKPADKKSQPVPGAEKKAVKAATTTAEVKKPAMADNKNKSGAAKDDTKKPVSSKHAKPKSVGKVKKTVPDSWSLVVGNYVLEEVLSADMGRVRKAGFEPIVKPSARKKSAMNRLFVSEFNDRVSAQATLEKLKRHTSDAFVIERGGHFAVYAGSYVQSESATSEKERLKTAGFTVTIKHTDIAIPSQSLSVGPFKNKKAADAALGTLKRAGVKATLSQK
jgi:cell division septation protein DedD